MNTRFACSNYLAAVLLILCACGFIIHRTRFRQRDLIIDGQTLSYWLDRGDAKRPLQILRTNVFPVFERVLGQKKGDKDQMERSMIGDRSEIPETWIKAVLSALADAGCDGAPLAPTVFDQLSHYASGKSPALFVLAHNYLLTMRCESIMTFLSSQLNSLNAERRSSAALYLIGYGPVASNAVPALRGALERGERNASFALTSISGKGPALAEYLLRCAADTKSDLVARFQCLQSLASLGTAAASLTDQIMGLLDLTIADSSLPPYLRAEYGNERWRQSVLGVLGGAGPAPQLDAARLKICLTSSDPCTRLLAARAMWRVKRDSAAVLPTLIGFLDAGGLTPAYEYEFGSGPPDPVLRVTWTERDPSFYRTFVISCWSGAADLLAEMGSDAVSAVSALKESLSGDHTVEDLFTRRAIYKITQDSTELFPVLMKCLDYKNSGTRGLPLIASAYFLGELGKSGASALQLLETQSHVVDIRLRLAAEAAIQGIRGSSSSLDK